MNKEQFINEITKLNINYTNEMLEKLEKYYEILYTENKKYNLTAITDKKEVYLKHFFDSLTITKIVDLDNQSLIDVGTGVGFPGIVLKIFFPKLDVTLLDSTTKKCIFLTKIVEELQLEKVKIINKRAEVYSKENREKYDIVTSRAVAPLKHLLEYSIPMLKVNGTFIALKSNITDEMKNIDKYYQRLSLKNETILQFQLPYENSLRTIYKVEKYNITEKKYPRQYYQIKKKDIM